MTWLITSDLHLTDRPRDASRFGLFSWLALQQERHSVSATFILGDITDSKDKHSSKLVNQIIDGLTLLRPPVFILKGNHDFIDPDNPFFGFLSCIEGIEFVVEPRYSVEHNVALIPHQPDQAAFDKACEIIRPNSWVFAHALFSGACAETGAVLTGLQWPPVGFSKPVLGVLAGDVHAPQRLANGVCYVGAPYHVRFGDNYTPRVLLVKKGKEQDLHYPSPSKHVLRITDADDLEKQKGLKRGDQVKVTITLAREEAVEWNAHKQRVLSACKGLGLEVYGVDLEVRSNTQKERVKAGKAQGRTPESIFTEFCASENVASGVKRVGLSLLADV